MTRHLAALLLFLLGACGPQVVWYGRTPDRSRAIRVIEDDGAQWVELDGRPAARYAGIGVDGLVASPDGDRLAYPARRDDGWVVVDGATEHGPFDGIGEVTFSPDGRRLAFVAEEAGAWRVVVDGRAGPPHAAVLADTLQFSPDGRRVAYVAEDAGNGATRVFLDGRPGPRFDGVGALGFSADGRTLAYLARTGEHAIAVVDGRAGPRFERIRELAVGATGRVAYTGRRGDLWYAVVDGRVGPPRDDVRAPTFSPDGARVAWAVTAQGATWVETSPPTTHPHPRFLAVDPTTLGFSPDGLRLAYAALSPVGWFPVVDGRAATPTGFAAIDALVLRDATWAAIARRAADADPRAHILVDGAVVATAPWAGNLELSPDGARVAYLAAGDTPGAVAAVVDGTAHPYPLILDGSLQFGADGRHWACLAVTRDRARVVIVVDGDRELPFDSTEVVEQLSRELSTHADVLASDGGLVRRWIAAELARVTR